MLIYEKGPKGVFTIYLIYLNSGISRDYNTIIFKIFSIIIQPKTE